MAVILVTGASGMLGGNLAADWADRHEVHGVFHQHRLVIEGVQMIGADLTDDQQVRTVMGKVKPELVVHCAAATDVDRCQREPEWADRSNRVMSGVMARASREHSAKLVHISTDAVFDGVGGPYSETDPPNPISIYGKSKLEGEQLVQAYATEAIVIRTNLFGWHFHPARQDLAEWFLDNLRKGITSRGFVDVFFSPILVNDLGSIILELVEVGAQGLFHVGGADCISKLEFGRKLAERFGFPPSLVEPGLPRDVALDAPRARRLCLDSSKVEQVLRHGMPHVDDGIDRMCMSAPRRWANEIVEQSRQGRDFGERREA